MRTFSPSVVTLLSRDAIETFMLVRYGTDRFTSLPYDIDIGGQGLFLATDGETGGLVSIEPPDTSSSLDKSSYKITLSDPNFVFRNLALSSRVGAPIQVWIGLINTTDGNLSGALPGEPLEDASDLILVYEGYTDGQHYSVEFEGAVSFVITGSSPFGDLDATKAFYTSKDFAAIRIAKAMGPASDTAYDNVFENVSETKIKWGKA